MIPAPRRSADARRRGASGPRAELFHKQIDVRSATSSHAASLGEQAGTLALTVK
jgi:hypothetical protein